MLPSIRVFTGCSMRFVTITIITILAYSFGIVREMSVGTICDLQQFSRTPLSSLRLLRIRFVYGTNFFILLLFQLRCVRLGIFLRLGLIRHLYYGSLRFLLGLNLFHSPTDSYPVHLKIKSGDQLVFLRIVYLGLLLQEFQLLS